MSYFVKKQNETKNCSSDAPDCHADFIVLFTDRGNAAVGLAFIRTITGGDLYIAELTKIVYFISSGDHPT